MYNIYRLYRRYSLYRRLELNTEKTKIVVFNKAGNEKKKRWKWGQESLEEERKFKYLGFVFNSKGNYNDQVRELRRKGNVAVRKVWGLGERICKGDFRRRWMLFKYLVQSVMAYGAEIWGWEEKKEKAGEDSNGLYKVAI